MKPVQIQLDFRSGIPIYNQITDQVTGLVLNGDLKPGDQLPTVRQLALELRVNFNTVARAYRMLDEAGLISTQQGRGTYILDQPAQETQTQFRKEALQALVKKFLADAQQLGFSSTETRQALEAELESGKPEK